MKTLGRFFILVVLSIIIATIIFFINSTVIISGWADKLLEIAFLTIPVFIILSILYFVNRALVKTMKGISKKKPSGKEDSVH